MEHMTEEKDTFQTQVNDFNSQIEKLKFELLKEQTTAKKTKVLYIYQYNYLECRIMSPK